MKGSVVEQQQMEIGGMGSGKMIEEELQAWSIEKGQFEKETLPRPGFPGAVQGETFEAVCRGQERLPPAGGEATAHDGEKATATLLLAPHAPLLRAALLRRLELGQEPRAERLLELRDCGGVFFGCARRGAWGLAWNL